METVEIITGTVNELNIVLPAGTAFGIVPNNWEMTPKRLTNILLYDFAELVFETVVQILDIASYLSNQTNTQ